jgi:hypothetical protein
MLAFAARGGADFKPLTKEEQTKIDKAIAKGVEFLRGAQTDHGDWKWKMFNDGRFLVGQCALPAYALLEAGVPGDDPLIKKAADFLRPKALQTDWTYEISLAILFFDRLGDSKDKKLIQTLAARLIAGQHRTGGWSYRCPILSDKSEQELRNSLEELSKRMQGGAKARDQSLKDLSVPLALQPLTVFQRSGDLHWQEPPETPEAWMIASQSVTLTGRTDNSNSQFAMLGLWTAQRNNIPVEPSFEIMVERFERFQGYPSGAWWYTIDQENGTGSMICVGLMGLAIRRGLKQTTPGANSGVEKDVHVLKGLAALRARIGKPLGNMNQRVPLHDLYYLWSVERVGMLYNLPTIGDKDWYRWGVEELVTNQSKQGRWPGASEFLEWRGKRNPQYKNYDYGPTLSTAFALLFLKRSHPMKDLTLKLPFTAKELNEGIARLRPTDKFPARSVIVPTQSRSLEVTTTVPKSDKNP